jgi:heptosyltransferase I
MGVDNQRADIEVSGQFPDGPPLGKLAPFGGQRPAQRRSVGAVLIVKVSSLGDVIQTMPVVSDILKAHPGAHIDWVVEEAFASLVARVQGVRKVIAVAQRRWRKSRFSAATRAQRKVFTSDLQNESYDAVIDFQGLIKSALVARKAKLAPGGFRATYANGSDACSYEWPVRYLLDKPIPMAQRIHAVARYRTLAAKALGYEFQGAPDYRLQSNPIASFNADAAQPNVVFAHGTTRADNEWPAAHWIELGHQLISAGCRIGLPQSSAAELAFATTIANALGGNAQVWPRLGLPQVLDHMAASHGVVGVDTGLSHLAVALGLPHVQIFSQDRAWRAGPVGQAHQQSVGGSAAPDAQSVWQAWQAVCVAKAQQA